MATGHWPLATDHFSRRPLILDYPDRDAFRREIPRLIVERNIHGIDIDPRAAQIAGLSLWLRAQRAWHQAGVKPADRPRITRSNLVCAEPMPGDAEQPREFVVQQFPASERPVFQHLLESIFEKMQLAGEAGSLLKTDDEIRSAIEVARIALEKLQSRPAELFSAAELNKASRSPELTGLEAALTTGHRPLTTEFWEHAEQRIYEALEAYAEQAENGGGFQRRLFADDTAQGFAFIDLCRKRYDVAVMNPPFGDASLPSKSYIDETYGDTKGDVYKAFVECFHARLVPAGYLGIISSRTGFFLGQSEDWRTRVVLRLFRPIALADLGSGVLDAMVEVAAYVLRSLSVPEARDLTLSIVPVLERVVRDRQDRFSLPKWQAARDGLKRHQAVAELKHLEAHGFVQRSPGDIVRYSPLWHAVKKVTAPPEPVFPPLVCVRALSVEDKEDMLSAAVEGAAPRDTIICDASEFRKIPTSPFAYWLTDKTRALFTAGLSFESNERFARVGPCTGDDFRRVRLWWEVDPDQIGRERRWATYAKVGSFSQFYADAHLLVAWSEKRFTLFDYIGRPGRWLEKVESCDCFFRPGLTWPRRSDKLSFKIMPAGCLFANKGAAAFVADDSPESLLSTLAVLNSRAFEGLLKALIARASLAQSFEVGLVQQTPFPKMEGPEHVELAQLGRQVWAMKRSLDSANPVSHAFCSPELVVSPGSTLAERAAAWVARVRTSKETIAAIQAEIDDIAFHLYGLDAADRAALTATLATEATEEGNSEAGEDEEEEAATADAAALATDLLGYAFGTVFGRWDIGYTTGELSAPELPDPFAPLPVCPPGMFQGDDGLPMSKDEGQRMKDEGKYPLRVSWEGVLVNDEEHSEDVVGRVREALEVIWKDRAEAIEHEACALLGVPTLREWFSRPAGFFADHLKRYSKSRRQAPIYWPLSTASGRYTLWIYYHRLTDQTLHKVLADFLDPKIRSTERAYTDARDANRTSEAGDLAEFLDELKDMRAEIERVIRLPWKPNLNDGVLITASPLWKLFRLTKWQRDLKACWEALEKGTYDWAHLAYGIWPQRVEKACESDRSLAIAHGLEHLCKVEPPKPKKARGAKKAAAPKARAKVPESEELLDLSSDEPGDDDSTEPEDREEGNDEPPSHPPLIEDTERTEVLCLIRQIFGDGQLRDRDDALREIATDLGYQRLGSKIRATLDTDLITAVRRGILENVDGQLKLLLTDVRDYERDFQKDNFLSALGRNWTDREDAIRAFARWLGYARAGSAIEDTARSLINGLLRENRLEADGSRIRRV